MSRDGGAAGCDAHIGLEEREAGGGRAEVPLAADRRHLNPAGAVHGGAIATLVDSPWARPSPS